MTILSTAAFYERAGNQIGSLRQRAGELQQQVASGEKLARSSDDPVAAARLRMLARRERLGTVDSANADRAATGLKLTDGALGNIADVIIRARELATQAANATFSGSDRGVIAAEIDELRGSLLSIANTRDAAGHALFGGEATGDAYAPDAAGTINYVGTGAVPEIDLGEGQSVKGGMAGPEVFGGLFSLLADFSTALKAGTGDPVAISRDALAGLDSGLEKVTTAQTVVGARLGWIELMDQRREAVGELAAEEEAELGGADIAETITRLQQTMTVLEASQASFVRLSSLTLFDMLR